MVKLECITKDFFPPLSYYNLLSLRWKRNEPTRALDNVSFSLPKGKVLAVLGPNGAGKTTLLKIISTLILPDRGRVSVNGYNSGLDDEKIKSSLGMVIDEERSFYWRLTGRQNLEFFASLYGMDNSTIRTRINALLDLFKVDYYDKRFDSYSTGMKKHFALMRGLLHDPELLLFDEPTKSLDFAAASSLRNFIKENLVKKQGKTIIFTTHQMDEALDFADLFMILDKGRLAGFGTLDELRKKSNHSDATIGQIFLKLTRENNNA
jgi:ABC-2 type transport system ATP-binding protein